MNRLDLPTAIKILMCCTFLFFTHFISSAQSKGNRREQYSSNLSALYHRNQLKENFILKVSSLWNSPLMERLIKVSEGYSEKMIVRNFIKAYFLFLSSGANDLLFSTLPSSIKTEIQKRTREIDQLSADIVIERTSQRLKKLNQNPHNFLDWLDTENLASAYWQGGNFYLFLSSLVTSYQTYGRVKTVSSAQQETLIETLDTIYLILSAIKAVGERGSLQNKQKPQRAPEIGGEHSAYLWKGTAFYKRYRRSRQLTESIIRKVIREDIIPLIQPGSTILEIAAGTGFGRKIIGANLPPNCRYFELDSNKDALMKRRREHRRPTEKIVSELQSLPKFKKPLDIIFAVAALDVIPVEDLSFTMNKLFSALKAGGKLINILDLSPNPIIRVEAAWVSRIGLIPTLYEFYDIKSGTFSSTGVLYIDKEDLWQRLEQNYYTTPKQDFLREFLENPGDITRRLVSGNDLDASPWTSLNEFGDFLKGEGLVKTSYPFFAEMIQRRIAAYAEQAGFQVDRMEIVSGSKIVNRKNIPSLLLQDDANELVFNLGRIEAKKNEALAKKNPDAIKIHLKMLFFQVSKPDKVFFRNKVLFLRSS